MTSRRILQILRGLFLITSLACLGISVFWPSVLDLLKEANKDFLWRHTNTYEVQLKEVRQHLRDRDQPAALRKLESMVEQLADVRGGDRLAPMKVRVLDMLVDQTEKAGQLEASLGWSDRHLEFDPRDFTSMLHRVEVLAAMGNQEQADAELEAAFAIGSASGEAQLLFIDLLRRRGERERLAETLLKLGRRGPLGLETAGWEIRWAEEKTFPPRKFTQFNLAHVAEGGAPSSRYRGEIPCPAKANVVNKLRLDMPAGSLMLIDSITCILHRGDGTTVTFTSDDIFHKRHVQQIEDRWVPTGGNDPYVVLEREGKEAVTDVVRFEWLFDLRVNISPETIELLSGPFDPDVRARWAERFGETAVAKLESLRG